jgi:hypothetical protein
MYLCLLKKKKVDQRCNLNIVFFFLRNGKSFAVNFIRRNKEV